MNVKLHHFLAELRRRNVYKAAVAYAVFAWLLIQFATQVFPFFEIPNWAVRLVILLLILGIPFVVFFAWAFEITPEGIKRTEDVLPETSITHQTGRKLTVAIAAVAAIALGIEIIQLSRPQTARVVGKAAQVEPTVPEKSIAVLPFENLSDEKGSAYFTDGVQDEVLTNLARIADLKVISRTSVMQYRTGEPRNLREIARQLGVAHILEGAVRCVGKRVRISAQLIDARTDLHQWAEKYDRPLDDIFAIQSEIAKAIADELQAKIAPRERAAIEQQPTSDLAAYDLYVRAKVLLNSTSFSTGAREKYLEAARLLDEAVVRDPSFFLAYYQLAHAHDRTYFFGYDHTPARLLLADAAVQTALRLRPDAGEAHLALAQHLYRGYRDYTGARRELAVARRTLPNDSLVYELTGYIDRRQGAWDESTRNLEKALDLDPRNLFILQQISLSYQKLRQFAKEAAILDRALALVPKDIDTRTVRAEVDLDWGADPGPLTVTIETILKEDPAAAETIAENWFLLALCKRDASEMARALAALHEGGINIDGVIFPRAWCEGLAARVRGDSAAAEAAFTAARGEIAKTVSEQPNYAQAVCVLGMIDAALGRASDALNEGRRAVELLPVTEDSVNGAHMIEFYAVICAWTGEKELALKQLALATQIPGDLSYGQLRLNPYWDPLRGDPRFEQIVASLAPEATK